MSNVCFAFGPQNSYLLNCPSKWARNNLPAAIDRLFTKQPPIKDVYELALGPAESYYIGYKDADNKLYCMNHGLPDTLEKHLSVNAKGFVEHDIPTTMITLGPNGSYVVKDKNKMQWCGIPEPLAVSLRSSKTAGTKLVALGVDNTYVVVNTDGSGLRNLRDKYTRLEELLANMKSFAEIHYLSLSTFNSVASSGTPDDPLFMLVRKNGSSKGLLPDGHDKDFEDIINSLPNMLPAPAPTRPQARGKSSSSTSFLKMLSGAAKAANLANQVINGGNGGGGGGGGYSDGNNYDTSGFSAGLQQQTWSSTGDAAGDPIQ
ncbi:MAG: hypothetical protein M1812_001448 [Candelaria pacifica]|nr:MAG: hypothetical protein M1812_001448 [Candelaria pacifica]